MPFIYFSADALQLGSHYSLLPTPIDSETCFQTRSCKAYRIIIKSIAPSLEYWIFQPDFGGCDRITI